MNTDYDSYFDDRYEDFEADFDPLQHDRQARRKRKPAVKHEPKKSRYEIIDEIADPVGLEAGFETTYNPGLFEEGWLLQSLREFYDLELISDVEARIRGGKEASVYRCAATSRAGMPLAAAKVYRPRMMRNLRNDAMYREGRRHLTADGKEVNDKDWRMLRHIEKKGRAGEHVAHLSWLMYEFQTMKTLHAAGANVPEPVAASENAILMGYCGDEFGAAPTLSTIALEPDEAHQLFELTLRNIVIMLDHGLIHGDLSAYNILYFDGQITLIDFPQAVQYENNTNAYAIFERDVIRVCEYFAGQGVDCDGETLADTLWQQHVDSDAASTLAEDIRLSQEDGKF